MEQVRAVLGDPFVAYCLNSLPESLEGELTPAQQRVIEDMTPFAQAILATPNAFDHESIMARLIEYGAGTSTSRANMWRQQCGGALVDVQTEDKVENALLSLGRDVYPACLLPQPNDQLIPHRSPMMIAPIFAYPAYKELTRAILQDASLRKLFPEAELSEEDNHDVDTHSYVMWTAGSGGTYQLALMPSGLLGWAADRFGASESANAYLDSLRQALAVSRALANKKRAKVPVLVGLANIELPAGSPITFPNGQLRFPTVGDKRTLMYPESVTAILETKVTLQLLSVRHWAPGPSADDGFAEQWEKNLPTYEKFQRELRREIDLARLAMLLASSGDEVVAPAEVASAVVNPLASGQNVAMSIFRFPISPLGVSKITVAVGEGIKRWAPKVAEHPTSLDMAMRRLLSAVSSRLDPMDGFVDAVICWENMFGTGEGEVSFRVCGAIAKLLEPDDVVARKQLFDELKNLYGVRSKLVHGAKEPKLSDAVAYRKRSVDIAVKALKSLYDRPELLATPDSGVRGRLVLLGA